MTKIALTPEDIKEHTARIEEWFGGLEYEVVQRWDDGYAAYWVILRKRELPPGPLDLDEETVLYCARTFVIGFDGRVEISIDTERRL